MNNRNRGYIELLRQKFDEEKYIEFISDLLNLEEQEISKNVVEEIPEQKQFKESIINYKYIAKYNDKLNLIGVFIIKLSEKASANARVSQRAFIATLLSKYGLDAAMVAFYQTNENHWRISFVKKELNYTERGVKLSLSPAKRYSYLVGEGESVHTAQEYLLKLLDIQNRRITLLDIENVFDVEKVTNSFFEAYKEKYLELKEYLDDNEDFKTEAKKYDFTSEEFAKKLMGQIVFLYFLQKKGWLGVQLIPDKITKLEYKELIESLDSVEDNLLEEFFDQKDDIYVLDKSMLKLTSNLSKINALTDIFIKTKYNEPWGTGDKKFVRTIFNKSKMEHKNFFDESLEPFFYTGLNSQRDNQYFILFNCKIPFLNGGLFEPVNNYSWESANFNIPDELFSNDEKTGILDIFDLYNFTIDEEEPLEKDIAVDPEMLGKIFENLLDIKDRKSTGSFYTPRDIVHYMCQESIASYLVNKVNVEHDEIINFIKYGESITQTDWNNVYSGIESLEIPKNIWDNILEIDSALLNLKICDPAVGSGAFPLGMLNEIVRLRDNISSYLIIQRDLGILKIEKLLNDQKMRDVFNLKLKCIQNSIYAVDLEPSAVDIAKLRLWLSLIVDYPNEEEPKPLPNLDYKIMQGNSLIDAFESVPLFNSEVLRKSMRKNASKVNVQENIFGEIDEVKIQTKLDFGDNGNFDTLLSTLESLQQQYFSASNSKQKASLKQKMEEIQYSLVEESLSNSPSKLAKFKVLEKNKVKPWFVWQLEFYDVFKDNGGFDIVIGNPPYGLINKKQNQQETIKMTEEELKYIKNKDIYQPAKGGLLNIFRLFVCKSHYLLKEHGCLCLIFPMAFMCDLSSSKLRRLVIENEKINFIEAFPERDDENKRVFKSAKMSVCILNSERNDNKKNVGYFYTRTHWDKYVDETNEKVFINSNMIRNIDEANLTIPIITSKELKVMNKIVENSDKMSSYSKCYEGEVNLTFHKEYIKNIPTYSKLIRGAQVQRYIITNTVSQGEILYIDQEKYLENVTSDKSRHFKNKRLVMQGITGINEKNRLKMALLSNNEFCANSANYIVENSNLKIEYILGILNSKMMNWYFKRLSTNSNVNGYEVDNLPLKIDKVNELVEAVENYLNYKNDNYAVQDVNKFEDIINNIVYEIYGLDSNDIDIIESA